MGESSQIGGRGRFLDLLSFVSYSHQKNGNLSGRIRLRQLGPVRMFLQCEKISLPDFKLVDFSQ